MSIINQMLDLLQALSSTTIIILVAGSLTFVLLVTKPIAFSIALPALYLALAALNLETLYAPVSLVRIAVGVATSLILAVTAWQQTRHTSSVASNSGLSARGGFLFRSLVLILAVSLIYGLYQEAYFSIPNDLSIIFYALIIVGILLILTSVDLLRKGLGLIILLCGFESLYLSLEPGLLVITLISIIDIFLVVAISYLSMIWGDDELVGESDQ